MRDAALIIHACSGFGANMRDEILMFCEWLLAERMKETNYRHWDQKKLGRNIKDADSTIHKLQKKW